MSVIDQSIKNPVLVNILMIAILLFGAVAFVDLPREMISEISFNWAFIIAPYPGASPQEVEDLIITPIEEEIADLDRVDQIIGAASEGGGFIMVKYETMDNDEFRQRLVDLKSEIAEVRDLPEEAEDIFVTEFTTADFAPVLSVILHGDLSEKRLKPVADDLKKQILDLRDVSKVEMAGVREREVWIELDPEALESHSLHPDQVSQAVAMANRNMPAGNIRLGRTEFLLRTQGKFENVDDVRRVVVKTGTEGQVMTVGDVARVLDTFEEERTRSRAMGANAVVLRLSKKSKASSLDVIETVRELVAEYETTLPAGMKITVANDSGVQIRDTLKVLRNNAFLGLLLVTILLYLFLGGRNAAFVAMGIPITFLAAFIFMNYYGESLNGNSIFGLVLVLGVVVDDAIIIVENCYRHYQLGKRPSEAARDGAKEVAWPVLSATMTTVAAFLPLMLMPGVMGKFMRIIPIVVCFVLAASMVEAFVILPSHFAEWSRKVYQREKRAHWMAWLKARYTPLLIAILRKRYFVLAGGMILTFVAFGMVAVIEKDLFAEEEINIFSVWVEMPEGTSLDATDQVVRQVEAAAATLPEEELVAINSTSGLQITDREWVFQNNLGEVMVELVSRDQGRRKVQEVIADLRGRVTDIPGVKSIAFFKPSGGPPTGKAVELTVRGKRWDTLLEIVDLIKAKAEQTPGVVDLRDDFESPKKELRIRIDPQRAAEFGLNNTAVASFFATVYQGQLASRWRDADEEVEIQVRYPQRFENNIDELHALKIPVMGALGDVKYVPFDAVAEIETVEGFPKIRHVDRDRAINILADVDKSVTDTATPNQVLLDYWESIKSRFPGYKVEAGGQFKEFMDSVEALGKLFMVGILLIYIILGGQFKSFGQPLIILFTIPFAFIGSMFGLIVSGAPFSIIAMFGMVALAGIAVNDAIVMVTFVNSSRANGASRWYSLIRAGRLRLRPIILTTVTTVGGLLPTALGIGGHSELWAPLANVIVWGMLVGTMMTLFVIPCLYAVFIDDLGEWRKKRKAKRHGKRARKKQKALFGDGLIQPGD
jgi:multidrug efflux pump subunit AcrB